MNELLSRYPDDYRHIKLSFPSLNMLSVHLRAEAFPYFFSLFPREDLAHLEELSLKIGCAHIGLLKPKAKPFEDPISFPRLEKLSIFLNPGSTQTNWCLGFFDFSAFKGRVILSASKPQDIMEIKLNFPRVRELVSQHPGLLLFTHVPSLRSLTMGYYTDYSLTDYGWEDPDESNREEGLADLYEILPSRGPLSEVETLHLGPGTTIKAVFRNFRASAICPNIRRLIITTGTTLHPPEPEASDESLNAQNPNLLRPLFPNLETFQLNFCHPFDIITEYAQELLDQIPLFNAPSGQEIQRVELHGASKVLQEAEGILKQSLPSGVKLETVDTKAHSRKKRHSSWSQDWDWSFP